MTQKEVLEIVRESKLWESLTQKEKQEAVNHALRITKLSTREENIGTNVDESI
jgi:ribosomal protein S21